MGISGVIGNSAPVRLGKFVLPPVQILVCCRRLSIRLGSAGFDGVHALSAVQDPSTSLPADGSARHHLLQVYARA